MKKVRHIGEVFIIQVSHGEYDDYTSYEFEVWDTEENAKERMAEIVEEWKAFRVIQNEWEERKNVFYEELEAKNGDDYDRTMEQFTDWIKADPPPRYKGDPYLDMAFMRYDDAEFYVAAEEILTFVEATENV